MTRLRLRFVQKTGGLRQWLIGHDAARAVPVGPLLLVAALGAGAAVAWHTWQAKVALTEARESLQALQRQAGQHPTKSAKSTSLPLSTQQMRSWIQTAGQLNTPWAALFDALEAATPADIALVSIEPDAALGSVRLQVEAKTLDALLNYAKTLNSVPMFASVSLTKHETNDQDSNRPLRLSLDIRLRGRQSLSATPEGGLR